MYTGQKVYRSRYRRQRCLKNRNKINRKRNEYDVEDTSKGCCLIQKYVLITCWNEVETKVQLNKIRLTDYATYWHTFVLPFESWFQTALLSLSTRLLFTYAHVTYLYDASPHVNANFAMRFHAFVSTHSLMQRTDDRFSLVDNLSHGTATTYTYFTIL